eukprot:COSAG05_NODE_2764_length_2670_cov_3.347779_3_plen_208_part_00
MHHGSVQPYVGSYTARFLFTIKLEDEPATTPNGTEALPSPRAWEEPAELQADEAATAATLAAGDGDDIVRAEPVPVCSQPETRAAACGVLFALSRLGPAHMMQLLDSLSAFVDRTEVPQSYTGYPDFNADLTDDMSTPYQLTAIVQAPRLDQAGVTCAHFCSLTMAKTSMQSESECVDNGVLPVRVCVFSGTSCATPHAVRGSPTKA